MGWIDGGTPTSLEVSGTLSFLQVQSGDVSLLPVTVNTETPLTPTPR